MLRRILAVVLMSVVVACGGDTDSPAGDASSDGRQTDAAPQTCSDSADCDDGVYCNGEEVCGTDGFCTGEPVVCDDGIDCTTDRCSESARACRHDAPDADEDGHDDATCLDENGDSLGDDCDDGDALRFPGNVERCDADHRDEDCNPGTHGGSDQDGDGFRDARCCNAASDAPNAAMICGDDCDDLKADVNPTASEICDGRDNDCDSQTDEGVTAMLYPDADRDGHGAVDGLAQMACAGVPGLSRFNDDCDDDNVARHGGQQEICDGLDNDCDPNIDESPTTVTWYLDADGDGFGDPRDTVSSCDPIIGRSLLGTDCNDDNAMVNPRAAEACDGIDNDCYGGANYPIGDNDFEDDDDDGVADARCSGGTDCNDRDPNTSTGATEICDGTDNDCDDKVDENTPTTVWYVDRDHDGYGNSRLPASAACFAIPGRTPRPGDCDDDDPRSFPTRVEDCDGVDNDCDREIDENCIASLDAGPRLDSGSGGTGGGRVDSGGLPDAAHPGVDASTLVDGGGGSTGRDSSVPLMDADTDGATNGTDAGADGATIGFDATTGTDAATGADAATGDAGVDPWPVIACNETTLLDGSANMLGLTVANQAESVPFCGLADQKIAVEITHTVNGCVTYGVFDVEDNVLSNGLGCGTFYQEYTLPGSRPYRAQISAPTVPQDATIRIWDVPTLPIDPILLNTMPFTRTTGVGQAARWSFNATAGQRITLTSSGPGCRQMTLYGTDGISIVDTLACGTYELVNFTVPATGAYELNSDSNGNAVGLHSVTGWVLGPDAAVSTSLGGSVAVPIPGPGNNGTATFSATAGQRISLTATNVGCTDFRLASPTDATVLATFACGTWFTDVLTLSETGVYTLYVNPSGTATGSSTINTYVLSPDPVVAATIEGPATPGSIDKPGNNLTYTFNGTAGNVISALATGPGCNTYTLWSPTSTSLSTQFGCGTWFLEKFTLPATGTYTITLNPNGAQVGATNLTLYSVNPDPIVAAAIDGLTVMSNVNRPGNNVTFEFTGTANQRITIRSSGPGCNTYTLYDMNNTSLSSQFGCGEWFLQNFILPATQTYAVTLNPNGSQVGAAQITIYNMPPDAMTNTTINGGLVTATITTPAQNALFTFNATAGQTISFSAAGLGCSNYTLSNPMGTALIGPTFGCGALNQSAFLITVTGVHTMLIDPTGTNTGNASFNVTSP